MYKKLIPLFCLSVLPAMYGADHQRLSDQLEIHNEQIGSINLIVSALLSQGFSSLSFPEMQSLLVNIQQKQSLIERNHENVLTLYEKLLREHQELRRQHQSLLISTVAQRGRPDGLEAREACDGMEATDLSSEHQTQAGLEIYMQGQIGDNSDQSVPDLMLFEDRGFAGANNAGQAHQELYGQLYNSQGHNMDHNLLSPFVQSTGNFSF